MQSLILHIEMKGLRFETNFMGVELGYIKLNRLH